MNNARRKEIQKLSTDLADLQGKIQDIANQLESIKDEEQEYYENMPESLQGGDKGDRAQEAVSSMEDALAMLEDFDIDEITNLLDTASE